MSDKQRVVALVATENDRMGVIGVYGPYESVQAASDALDILRGLTLPLGLKVHLRQLVVEEPDALKRRIQEFAVH